MYEPDDEEDEDNQQEKELKDFSENVEKVSHMVSKSRKDEPPTICEVPGDLTEGNNGAYIPKMVCIGPLFNNESKAANMARLERLKLWFISKLIVKESGAWSPEVHTPLLRECYNRMMSLVPRVRLSYSSISDSSLDDMSNEELAIKMLKDGSFILHYLVKSARSTDDRRTEAQLLGRNSFLGAMKRDLLLLSNQVPFFVLRGLLSSSSTSTAGDNDDNILVNGGLRMFSSFHPRCLHSYSPIDYTNAHHLLHLFYLSIDLPPSPPPQQAAATAALTDQEQTTWWVPSAKELEAAGVRFCVRNDAASFLDVSFRVHRGRGFLEIPSLQLLDYSETLFRNLIAFEQTYMDTPGRITAYVIFMDCLLKTTEDMRLLQRSGVLVNHMYGMRVDSAAMGFFSRLSAEVHTSSNSNHLAVVMDNVVRYHKGGWPRWRAALVTNPWLTTSVVASAILLICTLMQTFYTVFGVYYKQPK